MIITIVCGISTIAALWNRSRVARSTLALVLLAVPAVLAVVRPPIVAVVAVVAVAAVVRPPSHFGLVYQFTIV
jgi:hypothetical protein